VLNMIGRHTLLELEDLNVLFGRTYNDGDDDDGDDPALPVDYYYYVFTAIQFSLRGSSPYTSTDKTNEDKNT